MSDTYTTLPAEILTKAIDALPLRGEMNRIQLDPIEWDFRKIANAVNSSDLHLLIKYEYAREHKSFVSKISHWKRIRIPETNAKVNAPKRGRTIRGAPTVQELLEVGFDKLPAATKKRIKEQFPDRGWNSLEWLVHFPKFPKPFALADTGWRKTTKSRPIYVARLGESLPLSPFQVVHRYQLAVNWDSYSSPEIARALGHWARQNRPRYIPEINAQGRKATSELLKWLSALRLSKSETSDFEELKRALKSYIDQFPGGTEIIPYYQREHKWDEAIEKAKKYLDMLTP